MYVQERMGGTANTHKVGAYNLKGACKDHFKNGLTYKKYKISMYYICFSLVTWYILVKKDKDYNLNKVKCFKQICVDILQRKE
ncbi:hypothetical protein CON65_18030 [Bacillus pseudomycoides]|uniref:Uncharacterized protein n=1 Tax=Bacillus pseudomycoides TaxID=64104 RepID=A0AA91ZT61_9BACI|nr:hypothetical protein COO03_18510 [Bacillus sp. AFS098217]PED81293.1 hypothetical protein CON65_18030 [Bacillus pseudomycoides]PEU16684.1 hypothetical protein CN524_03670 [Bacillus sp. AFS019443]PEU16762.1 hypothetical protein CN525_15740 [Bacillus sp. AFS014408]PFW56693.1 hypothetical protein COL20_26900 [Bacillus sp. AFS075034]